MQHLVSQNVLSEGKCVPKFKYNLICTNKIPPNAPIVLLVFLDSKRGLIRVLRWERLFSQGKESVTRLIIRFSSSVLNVGTSSLTLSAKR